MVVTQICIGVEQSKGESTVMPDASQNFPSPYLAFELVDMRVGRVMRVEDHPPARKPAYKLWIDFGPELGMKASSAQIVANYSKQDLVGRLVVCAVNLGVRNIAGFASEVLTMGMSDNTGYVVLLQPASDVPLGSRIF
jgi:tRNA-binding protein